MYKKPFTLSHQTAASAFLLIVVSLLSLKLLTDYSPQFSERGEEVFAGYYFWVYLFSVFLVFILSRTRRLWRASLEEVLGGEVKSARFYGPVDWPWAEQDASTTASRFNTVTTLLCIALALGSLCFHWGESFRGVELLWHPTASIGDYLLGARGVQIVLILSIGFLLLCLVSIVIGHSRRKRQLTKVICRFRRYCAWLVLILLSFPILFTLLARYGEFMDSDLIPMLGGAYDYTAIFNLQHLPAIEVETASRGFLVFLLSCLLLAYITVESEQHVK